MTLCIPEAAGVPGLNGQPPTWPGVDALNGHAAWATASPSISNPLGLDDPRWQGHLGIGYPEISLGASSCCAPGPVTPPTFGTSTDEHASFRALYVDNAGEKCLYLSWWIKPDDSVDHSQDTLFVGFERQSGDPMVIQVAPFNSNTSKLSDPAFAFTVSTTPASGASAGVTQNWTENGGATPAWIDANTRVWLDIATNRWAVQMRVPIGNAGVDTELDIANTFKMWFEMSVELPTELIVPYSWPRDACVVDTCGLPSAINVPSPAVWEDFHLSTGAADPACPTTGFVKLDRYDVGTTNTPTSQINLVSPNTFEAQAENLTGASIDPGSLSAEFRIADWGSVADPAAPWNLIPATGGSVNPAQNAAAIADGTKGSITMAWQLNASEQADYGIGGSKSSHQCILVTLSGGFEFSPASVWRNMDFVDASTFVRVATISNVGLGVSPQAGEPRPAYILVEKLNMPARVDSQPPKEPREPQLRDGHNVAPAGEASQLLAAAAKAGATESDRLEHATPTIRYHTYHDTGLDVNRGGTTYRVLRPGTAFGFFVNHDGPLAGWRDELGGVVQIAENFYRLEVPEEGTAQVTTTIEALERPDDRPEPGGCGKWIADFVRWLRSLFGNS